MLKRPVYYVAKKELFANRLQAWFLNALGAFPVDRGASDQEMLETARAILDRGDAVLHLPRGHAHPPRRPRRRPKRGIGRLALETGAPGRPARRHRHRARPPRLAHPPAPRHASAPAAPLTFPTVAEPEPAARPGRHRPHLAVRRAAVGVARRPRAAAPRDRHRRRRVGHEPRGHAHARRPRGPARHPHARARRAHPRATARTRYLPGVALDGIDVARASRRRPRRRRPRPARRPEPRAAARRSPPTASASRATPASSS